MILINVDLPAPFSPRSAWIDFFLSLKFALSRALTPGKFFVILLSSKI